MSGTVIKLEGKSRRAIQRLFRGIRDEQRATYPLAEHLNAIFRACAVAGAGQDRVDSFLPYVRIHRWQGGFRAEVQCHDFSISEWLIPDSSEVTRSMTVARVKQDIPWASIRAGLEWYGDLLLATSYWKALEADILASPRNTFSRLWIQERSYRVERALSRSRQSGR